MINQSQLLIKLLKYQLSLRRYEAGQRRAIEQVLAKLEKQVIKTLDANIISEKYPDLPDFTEFTQHSIDLAMQDFSKAPSLAVIDRLYKPRFEGNVMRDWWARAGEDLKFKVKGIIRQGTIEGWDKATMTSFLRSSFDGNRRQAAAVVQTTIHTISNEARMAVYEANDDIIGGFYWLSTLDSRTTIPCVGRSGLQWDINKEPMGHNIPFATPPIHWNCRSIMMPKLLTFKDVGVNLGEANITRSSKLGQIDSKISFDKFLGMLSKSEQDDQLGIGRAQLWRDGKITLSQLLDATGRELTLGELKKLYD